MEWERAGAFIINNGFAVFVAVYMLTTMRKTLDANTAALKDISHVIEQCERKD